MVNSLLERLLGVPAPVLLAVVGALVFVEDALFVGFLVPGETVAILGGVAASMGHVSLWAVLTVVIMAAIVGDSVGFEVGRHFGARVLTSRRLDRHRVHLDDARDLLARRGGSAVLLGRWVAFFRAVMPALAGSTDMRYRTFLTYNALGGVLWGSAVVVAGYLAGASYAAVERDLGAGGAVVVGVVALVAFVVWRVRHGRAERAREQAARSGAEPAGDPSTTADAVHSPTAADAVPSPTAADAVHSPTAEDAVHSPTAD